MTELLMKRVGYSLRPWDEMAEQDMLELSDSGPIMVKVTKKRSLPHNRFYFACLRSMEKSGATSTVSEMHNAAKIKTGLVAICQLPNGEYVAFPDSTAFDKMDQAEFNAWFPKAVAFWKSSGLWQWLSPDLREKVTEGITLHDGREAA